MSKPCNIRNITAPELLAEVRNMKAGGYRLGQACATVKPKGFEILYSFDKDHELENLRLVIAEGEKVESISGEYWLAFIYENEMHDLFGIEFMHNALDFGGNFFRVYAPTPWLIDNPARQGADDEADAGAAGEGGLVCDTETCVYCTLCAKQCPSEALTVDRKEKVWKVDKDACTQCGICVDKCPKKCLEIKEGGE